MSKSCEPCDLFTVGIDSLGFNHIFLAIRNRESGSFTFLDPWQDDKSLQIMIGTKEFLNSLKKEYLRNVVL